MDKMIYNYENCHCKHINNEDRTHYIVNGVYSGIPTCCILNYIELLDNITSMPSYYMQMLYGDDEARYVRCVSCRKINRILELRKGWISQGKIFLE